MLMVPKIHIIGRKNAGKTTLVADLVREFKSRGFNIGTVKHTHHHHEFDAPGKDSHVHRQAGASVVGLVGPKMSAAFREHQNQEQSPDIEALLPMFSGCDLIIIEGQQDATGVKFEVWREATEQKPIASERIDVAAIVSDDSGSNIPCPIWPRKNTSTIADQIEALLSLRSSGS